MAGSLFFLQKIPYHFDEPLSVPHHSHRPLLRERHGIIGFFSQAHRVLKVIQRGLVQPPGLGVQLSQRREKSRMTSLAVACAVEQSSRSMKHRVVSLDR